MDTASDASRDNLLHPTEDFVDHKGKRQGSFIVCISVAASFIAGYAITSCIRQSFGLEDVVASPPYSGMGCWALPVVLLSLGGLGLSITACALRIKAQLWTCQAVLTSAAGLLFLGAAAPAVCEVLVPSGDSYVIPAEFPTTDDLLQSHCVVWYGRVILTPIAYTLLGVLAMFAGNAIFTLVRVWWHGESIPFGEALFRSVQNPSMVFIGPSFCYLLFYMSVHAYTSLAIGGWMGYTVFYMQIVNSGVTSFIVTAIFGMFLAMDKGGMSVFAGLRLFMGVFLLVLMSPVWITHIIVAYGKWLWFGVGAETCMAMLIWTFLPGRADHICFQFDGETCKGSAIEWAFDNLIWRAPLFCMFPMIMPVRRLFTYMGLDTTLDDANFLELWPGQATFMICVIALMKTIIIQALFMMSIASYAGVSYLDAVPIVLTSRHWLCQAHLLSSRALETYSESWEAWRVLVSEF